MILHWVLQSLPLNIVWVHTSFDYYTILQVIIVGYNAKIVCCLLNPPWIINILYISHIWVLFLRLANVILFYCVQIDKFLFQHIHCRIGWIQIQTSSQEYRHVLVFHLKNLLYILNVFHYNVVILILRLQVGGRISKLGW